MRLFKVEVEVKGLDEIRYRVVVLVILLLDDTNNILELLLVLSSVACSAAVGDDCCSQVSQNPRTGGLNGVDEGGGEENFADDVSCGFVVEEGEKSPVDEPCAVGKLCERVGKEFSVD